MDINLYILANIAATFFTAYWLTKENKAQATVINSLKSQLDTLNPFVDILKKFADPNDIEKLLDIKAKILEHDTEIKRRQVIATTTQQMMKQVQVLYENELKPKYTNVINELTAFVLTYFCEENFPDKEERNAHLYLYFPTMADTLISYLDNTKEAPSVNDANL